MDLFEEVRGILADLLDLDEKRITAESYLVRELGAESIDFIELAATMSRRFKIEIRKDEIFLKRLRFYAMEAGLNGWDTVSFIRDKYPHLPGPRVAEIVRDLEDGPALKVKDLLFYLESRVAGK
ncbi:MAG: acyl carrier protein [Syntrophales bacterium]